VEAQASCRSTKHLVCSRCAHGVGATDSQLCIAESTWQKCSRESAIRGLLLGLEHALPLLTSGRICRRPACRCWPPSRRRSTRSRSSMRCRTAGLRSIARADIVALTGMNVQRTRMHEILTELKLRGAFTVVADRGSPCVKIILATWPTLSLWARRRNVAAVSSRRQAGRFEQRYEQTEKTT